MNIIIKKPKTKEEFDQYYHVRWEVLRKPLGMPVGSEKMTGEDRCFHVIALADDQICGTGMLFPKSDSTAQIKQIAVLEKFRGLKIGTKIIEALEKEAQKQGLKKIIIEARKSSQNFYLKNEYKLIENSEHISIGVEHVNMEKVLY